MCILNRSTIIINAKSKNKYIFWECQFQINHQSRTPFLLVLGTNIYNDDNFILLANLFFCFGVIYTCRYDVILVTQGKSALISV